MELTFLGACREVGRSCFLLEGKEKLLLDCGFKPEKEPEYPLLDSRTARHIDRTVLSHAHLDHSAFLPALYSIGFRGKVAITKPTRDLIQLLLADFLRLNEGGKAPYSQAQVDKLLKNADILEFGQQSGARNFSVRLLQAGHILGAAMVQVDAEKKILYTGDFDTRETRLLDGADCAHLRADVLIIESTYGSKKDKHPSIKQTGKDFVDSINRTLRRGGKVIIPTFAIGRGQEILFTLESYMRSGALQRAPIYLDGMVTRSLRIYRHNAIYLKKEVQRRILTSDDDPFKSEFYFIPQNKDRSDVLAQDKAIILATSGMLNGGPVITYLKKLGRDPANKVILVGFQAEGTRGRDLVEGRTITDNSGESIEVNCAVEQAPFSGHADHDGLLSLAKSVKGLKTAFVVHGESGKCYELAADIEKHCKGVSAVVPELGETVAI